MTKYIYQKWNFSIKVVLVSFFLVQPELLQAEVDLSSCDKITKVEGRKTCYDRSTAFYNNTIRKEEFAQKIILLVQEQHFEEATEKFISFQPRLDDSQLKAIEKAVVSSVRPIPASARQKNYDGYVLLSHLAPNNLKYLVKIQQYGIQSINNWSIKGFERLQVEIDSFKDTKTYYHQFDSLNVSAGSRLSLFITRTSNKFPQLFLRTIYNAQSWLFVKRVDVLVDGTRYSLTNGEFTRDNASTVWEWRTENPSRRQLFILNKIASGKAVSLRFQGNEFYSDRKLQKKHKTAIREILALYEGIEKSKKLILQVETEENYIPQKIIRSVGSKPMRCFDPKRKLVYSHSPFGMSCATSDYPISDDDFIKLGNQ